MSKSDFWRGYWSLLFALVTAQLTQQADIIMMSHLGGAAVGAYAVLMRLAFVDVVAMMAFSAVASTSVVQAQRVGQTACAVSQIRTLAVGAGVCCSICGLLFYPWLGERLVGDERIASFIDDGVFWYSVAAPFRFLSNVSAFILHAVGRGSLVVRWKLIEAVAKMAGNYLFMNLLGLGFSGCFMSGLIVVLCSTIWCSQVLARFCNCWIAVPKWNWTARFLRTTACEAQRLASVQIGVLISFALFAAQWPNQHDLSRLNSYSAGQTLMLILFTPFMALIRFLSFRLAGWDRSQYVTVVHVVWAPGTFIAIGSAILLFESQDWLGRLYGQQGPWWATLVQALAISLPIRFIANVMRAILHAHGDFGAVAAVDSTVLWLIAVPLVGLGLYADSPILAYSSLVFPEAACATCLWCWLTPSDVSSMASRFHSLAVFRRR